MSTQKRFFGATIITMSLSVIGLVSLSSNGDAQTRREPASGVRPSITVQHADRAACDEFFQRVSTSMGPGIPPIAWGGCKQNVIVVAADVPGADGYSLTINYTDPDGKAQSQTHMVAVNELGQGIYMFESGVDDIKLTSVTATPVRKEFSVARIDF